MGQYVYAFLQCCSAFVQSIHRRQIGLGWLLLGALLTTPAAARITGTVYRDFNADGVRSYTSTAPLAGEIGVGGVTVTVYMAGNVAVGTTTSSSTSVTQGQFSTTPSAAGPYRVLFTTLPSGYYEGSKGSQSGTGVQFVNATTLPLSGSVASNTTRGLPAASPTPSADARVFDQVGKTGLGDIELSNDGTRLWAVSVGNRSLHRIYITNPTTRRTYTVWLCSANDACYTDAVVTLNPTECTCPAPKYAKNGPYLPDAQAAHR